MRSNPWVLTPAPSGQSGGGETDRGRQIVRPTIAGIRASRPVSSCSRKKLPECLGLIILFSSPVLAKGAKESRQQPGEEPPSCCSTPAMPRGPEAGAGGGGGRLAASQPVKPQLAPPSFSLDRGRGGGCWLCRLRRCLSPQPCGLRTA